MASWGGREGTIQVVIVFVFLGLAFIILSLRLFTRVIVTRNHGPEDWVITAAFVGLSSSSTRRVTIPDIQTVLLYHTSSTRTCWYAYTSITQQQSILTVLRGPEWSRSTPKYAHSR